LILIRSMFFNILNLNLIDIIIINEVPKSKTFYIIHIAKLLEFAILFIITEHAFIHMLYLSILIICIINAERVNGLV